MTDRRHCGLGKLKLKRLRDLHRDFHLQRGANTIFLSKLLNAALFVTVKMLPIIVVKKLKNLRCSDAERR